MENLRWIAAAALSAYACQLAVHHTTPIDAALPLLALAVTLCAWLSYPAVMTGVPLLLLAEIAIPDEPLRLLTFGTIIAAAIAIAIGAPAASRPERTLPVSPFLVTIAAILILRWIPLRDVLVVRELFLLAISCATVAVLGRTPFAVAVAVITALVTPALPMRTHVVPVIVFAIAALARFVGLPRLQLAWPSTIAVAFVMLFFPWSGIVARAFPYFLREAREPKQRTVVAQALAPNRSEVYEVPHGATQLVVSGANVAHLRRGALLGRIQPGNIPVRIGDAADWGYLRREAWYRARNPLPRDSAGKIRDYGYSAWVDGAGRVPLPRGARTIRVTADAKLPADASLQVEGFE
ncbi:MAG TPA: hypothetical protein VF883_01085 [Thermoanaerobaculia bacterium]